MKRGDIFKKKQISLNRFGIPDAVGALALFLLLGAAGYITGEIIEVGGGILKAQNAWRARGKKSKNKKLKTLFWFLTKK